MAKKKGTHEHREEPREARGHAGLPVKPWIASLAGYFVIAAALTFPLIIRMNSSVYGFYDHITTDMFANIHYYFWSIKHAIADLGTSPLVTPLFAAPFGSRMYLVNLTGYIHLPLTMIFGHLFSSNTVILFNLVAAGFGMYMLVRHLTKNAAAGFVAGVIFAFCPNMLVRSYTTFDSTQVQWIPFYTLYVLRFIEDRTWRNALLAGLFLVLNIIVSMPYFLVYLPVHTIVLLAVAASWRIWRAGRGFDGFFRDLTTAEAFRGWIRIGAVLAATAVVFVVYYKTVVGGVEYVGAVRRTTEQLEELAQKPSDYLMPHPRMALLKGNIKESYWNRERPGKDPDSFVAYIGYITLALAVFGAFRGRRDMAVWMFAAGAVMAFWATLGPRLFGLPTPSGFIHAVYAPFARRILLYKVFVQFGAAGLAGIGISAILDNPRFRSLGMKSAIVGAVTVLLLAEYSIVPPALSVDLTETPELYERVRDLPDDTILFETPFRRNSGNLFQGYVYYQTFHEKPLFNPYFGLARVPEHIRPLYTSLEVPLEAQEYCNLAALRWLGVTHLTYHWYIGTKTVMFGTFRAPGFVSFDNDRIAFRDIDGLDRIYTNSTDPFSGEFRSPYDYTFANLYEIIAEPCPVALTFDYSSPYDQIPGMLDRDGMTEYGWKSALVDTTGTFYYPLADGSRCVRLLRQGGLVTASNLSDVPVAFSVTFIAEGDDAGRMLEARWNGADAGRFEIGPSPTPCVVEGLSLGAGATGELTLWSGSEAFRHTIEIGGQTVALPTSAVLWNFRVNPE